VILVTLDKGIEDLSAERAHLVADHRLTIDATCSRYGPALERMWVERDLPVPDAGVRDPDDQELVLLVDRLRDLLEALVRQQTSTDRASALAADPHGDASKLDAARAQADRIDRLLTGALGDEAVRRRLYRLKALIGNRKDSLGN
jgi:hypothetical protein